MSLGYIYASWLSSAPISLLKKEDLVSFMFSITPIMGAFSSFSKFRSFFTTFNVTLDSVGDMGDVLHIYTFIEMVSHLA